MPNPAPAEISPVGFSSTEMLIIFEFSELPGLISEFTDLKKRRFLRLLIVLFANISLYGSPSSISN